MSEGAHRRTNSTPAVSRADSSEAPSACTSTFLNLRKRLATEERPAGLPSVVVAFVVGEEQWVIDLRDGLTAEQAVRRGEAESPDVACKLSPADFAALPALKLRDTEYAVYAVWHLTLWHIAYATRTVWDTCMGHITESA